MPSCFCAAPGAAGGEAGMSCTLERKEGSGTAAPSGSLARGGLRVAADQPLLLGDQVSLGLQLRNLIGRRARSGRRRRRIADIEDARCPARLVVFDRCNRSGFSDAQRKDVLSEEGSLRNRQSERFGRGKNHYAAEELLALCQH